MRFLSILIFAFTTVTTKGQELTAYIKQNSIKIIGTDSLDNKVYQQFSGFRCIMLGEMHGTNEPAKFAKGLVQLLIRNGDTVQLGLEIPSEEMATFFNENSDSSVYSSEFFSKNAVDGRENYAWVDLISRFHKSKKVNVFFFDVNKSDYIASGNRDSLMYVKIKEQIRKYPGRKMITLSGNIHNMLQPYKGDTTMACYLKADKELNISNKLCSLNHLFSNGTMNNNVGNGLELREVKNLNPVYSRSVDSENYLLLYSNQLVDGYNGVLYTKYVTAAKITNK